MNSEIEKIKGIIDEVTKKTFKVIKQVYEFQRETTKPENRKSLPEDSSRILFPKYSENNKTKKGKIRISEQELRFIFVEHITKNTNLYCSVETPTHFTYKSAKDKHEPSIGGSMSGKIDLTLYENPDMDKPIAFIEFKFGNLSKNDKENGLNQELKYDFIKLVAESQHYHCLGFSLHLIENPKHEIKNPEKYISAAVDIIQNKPQNKTQSEEFKNPEEVKVRLSKIIQYKALCLK